MNKFQALAALFLMTAALHAFGSPAEAGQTLWFTTYGDSSPGAGTLQKISDTGDITTVLTGLNNPAGITFDSSGNVYFVNYDDAISHAGIMKLDPAGNLTTFVDQSQFASSGLQALAIDASGNIYATGDNYLFKVTPGGVVSTFSDALSASFGMTIDPFGNIYAASFSDGGSDSFVSKFDAAGNLLSKTFISGANDVAFANDSLYVAATGTSTIDKIDSNGILSVFATNDNIAVNLAATASGTIYSWDTSNAIQGYDNAGNPLPPIASVNSLFYLAFQPQFDSVASPEPSTILMGVLGVIGGLVALRRNHKAYVI